MTISEQVKARLVKDRPMTSVTLRIPQDVIDSLKEIAPLRGMAGYQTLLKSYISEGLRRDESLRAPTKNVLPSKELAAALRRRGIPVSAAQLEESVRDLDAA